MKGIVLAGGSGTRLCPITRVVSKPLRVQPPEKLDLSSKTKIAEHLEYCSQTVRDALRAFLAPGADALRPFRPGAGPDIAHRERIAEEPRHLLTQERTWTSRQLAAALAQGGSLLGDRQVRRHLKRIGAGYRRTASTLKYKQDPAKARPARRILANLKAKGAADLALL